MTLPAPKLVNHEGTLTDYEGNTARIDDKPVTMTTAAAKWCAKKLKKGMGVEFEVFADGEDHGKIRRIWEKKGLPKGDSTEKRQAAGFDNPPESTAAETKRKEDEKGDARIKENDQYVRDLAKQQSGGSCTSPAAPAESPLTPDKRSGPQKSAGEIVAVDLAKHTMALKNADGIITGYVWRESSDINQTMQKQKVGWYVGVTYEAQGDRLVLTDIHYEERPANMRRGNSSGAGYKGGGRSYQPKNERAIIFQVLLKGAIELMVRGMPEGKGVDLRKDLGACIRIAEEALPDACKAAGVQ